jgi:hypothetical protein
VSIQNTFARTVLPASGVPTNAAVPAANPAANAANAAKMEPGNVVQTETKIHAVKLGINGCLKNDFKFMAYAASRKIHFENARISKAIHYPGARG